jgi:hypothetical protein
MQIRPKNWIIWMSLITLSNNLFIFRIFAPQDGFVLFFHSGLKIINLVRTWYATTVLVPLIKCCQRFKTLRMACPFVDFKRTNTSSFYKTVIFNPLHLMSLFSTPIMFLTTFLSRFLFGTLILGNLIYMKHKQPSTLH